MGLAQDLVISQYPSSQDFFSAKLCMTRADISINKLKPNTHALCSESQINCGNSPKNPATTVPRPKSTSIEGMAQQMSVPKEVNKESQPKNLFIRSPLDT